MSVRAVAGGEAGLGRDDHEVTRLRPAGQPAADDLLGPAIRVYIGGVDQRSARRHEPVKLREGVGLAGLFTERQRAEGERGDRASAAPDQPVLHHASVGTPRSWISASRRLDGHGSAWVISWERGMGYPLYRRYRRYRRSRRC